MRIFKFIRQFSFLLMVLTSGQVCAQQSNDSEAKFKVFVSILPQAYFVERVAGNRVDVSVMVGPGQSPATYEPRPKQMASLGHSRLYVRIGVPFESMWMERIKNTNPHLNIIDTRHGIELRNMKTYHHHGETHARDADHGDEEYGGRGMKDPHIWLSLRLVKKQAETICKALISEDPEHRAHYEENLKTFHDDLDRLDQEISDMLRKIERRKFMVFHPSLGYFARDYDLEQVPIEIEGKEPSAKDLAHLIEEAKDEGVRIIFVQKQFSQQSAEVVARAIGGKVVQVDPLSKDYLENMKKIAQTFGDTLQ